MGKQKYRIGQIFRYSGPDLVAYEQGKTYTVLGYDKKLDLYRIISELDEAYLLPEDVLKPLSEKEEKEIKISDHMYEYYHDTDVELSSEDLREIDENCLTRIIEMAKDAIQNSRLKRERKDFNSDSEYRIYLSDLAGETFYLKHGIETLSQSLSEYCLYINEFDPKNVIKTKEGDKYNWRNEESVFDGSYSPDDKELDKYLGNKTYDSYEFYPSSCCWLFDKESLLKLADSFPEIFQLLDRTKLNKDYYVVIECHWD